MSNCNEGTCHTEHEKQEADCPVTQALASDCCPVEKSVERWTEAFPCAMKEVQKDILKEKIRKSWGAALEKEADAFIEASGAVWTSLMQQAKAKCELREKIGKIYEQACDKK